MKNRNGETEVRKTPLLGPAICSLLLLLCIAFAVYKLYADNAPVAAQSNPDAERQAAVNGQLREEKAWLEALGGKKPCDIKEELSRQGPQSIFGGGGAGTQNAATASPQSVASAPPQPEDSSPSTADSRASGPAETPAAVADLLEDATVFVLGQSDTGMSMGSGFFFASDLIFTNRHVVE
ncbi:MAG: hypothetical protein LBN33_07970, partial [Desulfovibrio sp.]|nr:hypothetical protein [Desulfovibrio sp.]